MDSIKDRLNEAMKKRDMSVNEVADRAELNRATVYRYLQGKVVPKQKAIYAMSKALGVSPVWLLGFDDENEDIDYQLVENNIIYEVKKLSPDGQLKVKNFVKFLLFEEGLDDGNSKV